MHPVRLIKVDESTGEVIRQSNGLCIPCRPGETGAMVSTIRRNNPLLMFEGYLNKSETSKKVLKDVFQQGDSVFLSGLFDFFLKEISGKKFKSKDFLIWLFLQGILQKKNEYKI